MKKIRYLPFGYTIRNGHTVIEQQEADVVRNIFRSYIQGASLKEIAEDLTAKKIPYTERTCVWDKARISRILENAKYTGNEEFETIIDENIYEEAAAVKSARRWNQAAQESEGIRQIRDRVRCGQWEFAGLYADEGISGTRADKRPEFQRMIRDCQNGKIEIKTAKLIQFDFSQCRNVLRGKLHGPRGKFGEVRGKLLREG